MHRKVNLHNTNRECKTSAMKPNDRGALIR